jgi:organic hydroperoxide reductase OsmC/OhrA
MAEAFVSHLEWTGAGKGPTLDTAFSRDLNVTLGATALPMSSAPGFQGDASRVNPEQLFVASLSACHALTYLFLAARNGVAVTNYADDAEGWLEMTGGKLTMSRVRLRPRITLADGTDEVKARELTAKAHRNCFIANSVTTHVEVDPTFEIPATVPR